MGIFTIRVIDPSTRVIYRYDGGGLQQVLSSIEEIPASLCSIDWGVIVEDLDS
jgi:hypothetical protein